MTMLGSYFSSAVQTMASTSYRCVTPLVSATLNTVSATVSIGKKALENTVSLAQATTSTVSTGVEIASTIATNLTLVGLDAAHKTVSAVTTAALNTASATATIAQATLATTASLAQATTSAVSTGVQATSTIASNLTLVGLDAAHKTVSAVTSYLPTTEQTIGVAGKTLTACASIAKASYGIARKAYNYNAQLMATGRQKATTKMALYAIHKPLSNLDIKKAFMEKPSPTTNPEKNFVNAFFSKLLGPFLGEKVSEKILQSQKEDIEEFQANPSKVLGEKEKVYPIIAAHLHKLFAVPNLKSLVNELLKDSTQFLNVIATLDMTKDSNAIQQELLQKLGANPQTSVKEFKKQIMERVQDNLLAFLLKEEEFLIKTLPPLLIKDIQSSFLQSIATGLIKACIFLFQGLAKFLIEHSKWPKRIIGSLIPSLLTMISSLALPELFSVGSNTNLDPSKQDVPKVKLNISEDEKKKLEEVGNACFEITFLYLLDRCVRHLSTIDLSSNGHATPGAHDDLQENWNSFAKALIPLTNTTIYNIGQHMKVPVWGVNQFVQWTMSYLPIPEAVSKYYHPLTVLQWINIDDAVKTVSVDLQNSLHIDPRGILN